MKKDTRKQSRSDVLQYKTTKANQGTIRKYYLQWRQEKNLPVRCDNSACLFHTNELVWLGKPLRLILDHVQGNRFDNRPDMLRLLCPNCESQLYTSGGRNRGRVKMPLHPDAFTVVLENGAFGHTQFGRMRVRITPSAKQTYTPNNALKGRRAKRARP